jgi:putative PIN family toxin of toxin-antitoxin system
MTGDLRVVFDCNVFLQAMSDTGAPSGQCVKLAFEGKAELFISRFVINELRRVTTRPKVVAKLRLSSDRIDQFLTAIERVATLIVNVPEFFSYRRDPTDAHYINLALAANAKLIVSRDRDLLDLMDRTKPEAADFNNRFPQLQILDPVEFLREVSAT